ncbi:long-chain fatty acid--CoA ligase [Loktanella sp. IMCC34160]|uniref:class I adenylate-forming enzyme family protein n=1 Tax=Loktanella sp. IMCC34160 TaxID=2510646 RepID=UPI00101B8CB3|nr:class I adenylate-forming enzyme family protein [Loktanella sp. IMCC34160]RYG93102.1 long-chain fatty acid--CoA ligase [Loktanella sp. IMCC34160]
MLTSKLVAAVHAEAAKTHPDQPALVFPDQVLTHDQLRRLGLSFASRMQAAGVGVGSRVQLRTPEPTLVLAVLLATSWLGAQFVPFAGEGNTPVALSPTHYLYDPNAKEAPSPDAIAIDPDWSPARTDPFDVSTSPSGAADADWLWVHTSGTTGIPKYLALSQSMVVARSLAVGDEFSLGSKHVLLAHVYSRPFLARAIAAMLNLSTLYFDLAPDAWHDAGINMVSGSRSLLKSRLNGAVLSPKLPVVELAGSRLPEAEAIEFLKSFETVDDTYGASETSKSYSTFWTLGADGAPVQTGRMRDSEFQILGLDNTPVGPGESGVVRVRNPYMAKGYLDDPEASANSFRDGWFYPGDVAKVTADGRLSFADRSDNVINIYGAKVNGFVLDQIFRQTPGIKDAICFRNPKPGADEELFAFVVYEEDANQLQAIASAKFAVEERMGEELVPRVCRPVNAIPRKADGTPDRQACADLVLKVVAAKATQPD